MGDQRGVRAEVWRRVMTEPAPNTIGEYAYSNVAYIIAGAVLEHLVGLSWEALIHQKLFVPLGMDECGFGMPAERLVDPQPQGTCS